MSRRKKFLIGGFIFLLILKAIFGGVDPSGSTYSTSPSGAKAIYLLLEHIGRKPRHLVVPFKELPDKKSSVLLVIAPDKFGGEKELAAWVEKGNRVLYFGTPTDSAKNLLLAFDVKIQENDEASMDRIFFDRDASRTVTFTDSKTNAESNYTISKLRPAPFLLPKEATLISGSMTDPEIFSLPYGKSELIFFSDARFVQNEFIDAHNNIYLIAHYLRRNGSIYFDEFHHGYIAPAPNERKAQLTALYWSIGIIISVFLLWALCRSVRFGPPHEPEALYHPPSTPFIEAFGSLLYAKEGSAILSAYLRAFRIRAERAFRISRAVPDAVFLRELQTGNSLSSGLQARVETALSELSILQDGSLPAWERHLQPLEELILGGEAQHGS